MESVDQQFRQQKENYRAHDRRRAFCSLRRGCLRLTEIAREALQAILSGRGIAVRLKLEPPPPAEPLEDDEGLINLPILGWPDNAQDARLTMGA